jgi:predicted O-methyltransferase YrrM
VAGGRRYRPDSWGCVPGASPDAEKFDFVFFDVFNTLYPQLLEISLDVLHCGGVFVADDTLDEPVMSGETKKSIHCFNTMVAAHPALYSTLVPVGFRDRRHTKPERVGTRRRFEP